MMELKSECSHCPEPGTPRIVENDVDKEGHEENAQLKTEEQAENNRKITIENP